MWIRDKNTTITVLCRVWVYSGELTQQWFSFVCREIERKREWMIGRLATFESMDLNWKSNKSVFNRFRLCFQCLASKFVFQQRLLFSKTEWWNPFSNTSSAVTVFGVSHKKTQTFIGRSRVQSNIQWEKKNGRDESRGRMEKSGPSELRLELLSTHFKGK